MKNLLLFSILLSTTVGTFAQLSVEPTAGGVDSYIYVKDEVLYVKGAIELTKNSVGSTEASIYLRDNGQLIQGRTSSSNTGDGLLSVQQNTLNTNAYSYYYWCSPVGNPDPGVAGIANNKNFGITSIYEKINPNPETNARVSLNLAQKSGFTDPRLTISKRWIYSHPDPGTEAAADYFHVKNNSDVEAGFGFTMKGVNLGGNGGPDPSLGIGHDQTYDFRGRPNNGDFTITVQGPKYTGGNADVNARMTLSGNPYPSALDLNRVFWETGNEPISAFYFYDEDRSVMSHNYSAKPFGYSVYLPGPNEPNSINEIGTFVNAPFYIWNAGGGSTSTGNSGTQVIDHRFSPIGQGIMFVGTNPAIPEPVTIKNTHRRYIKEGDATHSTHSVFHRPNGNNNDISENKTEINSTDAEVIYADTRMPQTRLYVIFDEALTREMLLTFSEQSTDGYDRGMDGLSPMGMKTDAYFPVGNDNDRSPYVINSVNYELDKQIPFAFKLDKTTKIRLSIAEEVKRPYEKIYLFDRQENTYRRLGKQTTYPFSLTLDAGTYDNRFFIVFRHPEKKGDTPQAEIDAENAVLASVDFFQNNPSHQLEVRNPEGYTIKSAAVYDMTGKLVIQEQNLGDTTKFTFYTGNLSDGVYLVKLITSDNIIVDYKAMIHNK